MFAVCGVVVHRYGGYLLGDVEIIVCRCVELLFREAENNFFGDSEDFFFFVDEGIVLRRCRVLFGDSSSEM